MIRLDAATVLLQWATGGLLFLWVTTRHRQVGIGYGWLMRIVFGLLALGAVVIGRLTEPVPARDLFSALTVGATGLALAVSIVLRKAGVTGEHQLDRRKADRVKAMLASMPATDLAAGQPASADPLATSPVDTSPVDEIDPRGREFPPGLDLMAPIFGAVGLVFAAGAGGGPLALALVRTLAGALFLGAVTDAMLLGHWYLVQPGLGRGPLRELNRWLAITWPLEVGALLWPIGMLSVLSGRISDGWGGTLGWFWVACALSTIVLTAVTRAALKERAYSAVMAATGLLYLAILTAFGTDLVARAILA